MKATITILLLAFTLTSCMKEEDNSYRLIPVQPEGTVPGTIEEVQAALVGTWYYEGEGSHYVSYGADGIRCIGYSTDSLDQCMAYDVYEENEEVKIGVYAIGNIEGTGNKYCMVATVLNLTDSSLQYQSTVYRSLQRLQ